MGTFRCVFLSLVASFILISCGEATDQKTTDTGKKIPRQREEMVLSFAPVVKKVAPAVVNIYAEHREKLDILESPFLKDPFFRQFFDHYRHGQDYEREKNALGSGVIVSANGLVLTNYHVIKEADVIRIVLSDKREYKAKLLVVDKRTDLALLQIEGGKTFSFLEVRPQEDLEVGDIVLAIGNPFGVGQTVTSGIVSALARSQEGISNVRSFIQTDASINPGNSGGPLVTSDGRLVGINTAIYSKGGGSIGIGFAIPTSLAIPVIESVDHGGDIIRPWLGLEVVPITPDDAQALGLSRPYGVLVKNVYPKGPAEAAGIKRGDFISAFDGQEIEDDASFDYKIAIAPVGKKASLTILRKGEEKDIDVVLAEPLKSKETKPLIIKGANPLQGAKIEVLSPALALHMDLNPMTQGVVILDLGESSPAAHLGFSPGDVIESINKKEVNSIEEVLQLLETKRKAWHFTIRRGNKLLTLQMRG